MAAAIRFSSGSSQEAKIAKFESATRVQEALTAKVEKKALVWMANRAPRWLNSDHLTLLGFVAQFLTGASYALARWYRWALLAAMVCIALNWLGDSLDGTLARVRNRQRPRYGFYVDHIIDSFGAMFLCVGLALSGYMHPAIAIGLLVAFLLLSIESYLATYTVGKFQMSHGKLGPTEIRILLIIGNAALLVRPVVRLGGEWRLFDVGGVVAIVSMTVMLVLAAIRNTIRLYKEEKLQ